MILAEPIAKPKRESLFDRDYTIEEYHELLESHEIGEEDDLELIDGRLERKMSRNNPHDFAIDVLDELLQRLGLDDWRVRCQLALTLKESFSEPEPDFALVRGERRTFAARKPTGEDAGMVIEVAESSLEYDRTRKYSMYARSKVPVYWIVNVIDNEVEVHEEPVGRRYMRKTVHGLDDSIAVMLDGVAKGSIPVRELFA